MHPNSAPPKLPARRARGAPHCSRSKGRPREGPLRGYSQKMCLGLSQGGRQGDGQQNSKQLGAELPARPHLVPGSRSARACPRVLTRVHGAGRLRPRVGAASARVGLTGRAARGRPAWHGSPAGARMVPPWPGRGGSHGRQHPAWWAPWVHGPQDLGRGLRRSRGQPQASGPQRTPLYYTRPRHPNTNMPVATCSLDMGRGGQDGCLSPPKSPPGVPAPHSRGGCRTGQWVPFLHSTA